MTTKTKLITAVVLLLGVFLVGFVPQYMAKRQLQEQVREFTETNTSLQRSVQLSDLERIAGMMLIEVLRQNFGLATELSSSYFTKLSALLNETTEAELKTALEQLAADRDSITASLAQADSMSSARVQDLLVRTNAATEKFRRIPPTDLP
jgi:hypothetical protein